MTFHKTTAHYKAWADFKAANMDTVGASQVCYRARIAAVAHAQACMPARTTFNAPLPQQIGLLCSKPMCCLVACVLRCSQTVVKGSGCFPPTTGAK